MARLMVDGKVDGGVKHHPTNVVIFKFKASMFDLPLGRVGDVAQSSASKGCTSMVALALPPEIGRFFVYR